MKIELLHVVNGYRKFHLGFYDDMHQAIKALKIMYMLIQLFQNHALESQ